MDPITDKEEEINLARIKLNMARIILDNRIYHFECVPKHEDKIREVQNKVRVAEDDLNRLLRQFNRNKR